MFSCYQIFKKRTLGFGSQLAVLPLSIRYTRLHKHWNMYRIAVSPHTPVGIIIHLFKKKELPPLPMFTTHPPGQGLARSITSVWTLQPLAKRLTLIYCTSRFVFLCTPEHSCISQARLARLPYFTPTALPPTPSSSLTLRARFNHSSALSVLLSGG